MGNLLSTLLDEAKIKHFPYGGGFFLTLKIPEAKAVCLKLEEEDIYLVPIGKEVIRIAISGLNQAEIERLAEALKRLVQS